MPLTPPTTPTPPLPTILPSPFISVTELNTHIYEGVVTAITDSDSTIMPQAIEAATNEAMGYLSRFDYVTILEQTGAARDPVLLMYIKDMAVWHFMALANPNLDWDARRTRYDQAIKWLEKVQEGTFVPAGWPPAPCSPLSTEFHVMSTQGKRWNNY
jgi:phage gp36-like protein